MSRIWCAPLVASIVVLAACEDPAGPLAVLDVEMSLSADSIVPGYPELATIVARKAAGWNGVAVDCLQLGFVIIRASRPDDTIPGSWAFGGWCRDRLVRGIAPGDSSVHGFQWDASTSLGETLEPGDYELRPFIARYSSNGEYHRRDGRAVRLTVLPWAGVRVANTYEGLPSADIVIGGRLVVRQLAAGLVSPTLIVPVGAQPVEVRSAISPGPVARGAIVFHNSVAHTIVLRVGPGGVEPWDVTDTTAPTSTTQNLLRVINAAAKAPAVDVYGVPTDGQQAVPLGTPFGYGAASAYLPVASGVWTILVTSAGGTDTLLRPVVRFTGGERRTVVVMDDHAGGLLPVEIDP